VLHFANQNKLLMHWAISLFYIILLLITHRAGAQTFDKTASYVMAPFEAKEAGAFSISGSAAAPETGTAAITQLLTAVSSRQRTSQALGFTKEQRPVMVYYFPGRSNKMALVISGVHGSELASIEVANRLVQQLSDGDTPFYNVLIIPSLFPDNAARATQQVPAIGSPTNIGRYTHDDVPDPNRQMPCLGQPYNLHTNTDALGRAIEYENGLLLQLIQACKPQRIANIHAIRNLEYGGIYADPRTNAGGYALGFESDSSLALAMAQAIVQQGGTAPGNRLDCTPTALYYKDPPVAALGQWQQRNTHGSVLSKNRGRGVSLGSWASTAVVDTLNPENDRPAIRLLTIEFPGYKRPLDYTTDQQPYFEKQVALYASAIQNVFLAQVFVEDEATIPEKRCYANMAF
jgi:hypothetical protein